MLLVPEMISALFCFASCQSGHFPLTLTREESYSNFSPDNSLPLYSVLLWHSHSEFLFCSSIHFHSHLESHFPCSPCLPRLRWCLSLLFGIPTDDRSYQFANHHTAQPQPYEINTLVQVCWYVDLERENMTGIHNEKNELLHFCWCLFWW